MPAANPDLANAETAHAKSADALAQTLERRHQHPEERNDGEQRHHAADDISHDDDRSLLEHQRFSRNSANWMNTKV